MSGTTIAVIPGDGIGPAVIGEALATLACLDVGLEFDVLDTVNARTYLTTGTAMTDAQFARVAGSRSALFGAVGDPRVKDPEYARSVLMRLRSELDLWANVRPVRLLHDRLSPLRNPRRRRIDCTILRENTEGLYSGIGGRLRAGTPAEVAIDAEVSTHLAVSRIVELAMTTARERVCLVDKSNAVPMGGGLWQRCWRAAAARYPDLDASHLYVDAAAMALLRDPTAFEVVVTNNSYGDILSDLAAELGGGLGAAASANVNADTGFGLFEPVHGSAPDLVGTERANPVGAILSAALLLAHLGHRDAAEAVRAAVARTVEQRRCTPDLGGTLTTRQAGEAIRACLG